MTSSPITDHPGVSRLRLVGIGRSTRDIVRVLETGTSTVIGRHADCTIVCGGPGDAVDAELVSRQHAVVEEDANANWIVYDTGSTNGTILMRGGIPPSIVLEPGTRYPIGIGDVIELAASDLYRFAVEPAEADVVL